MNPDLLKAFKNLSVKVGQILAASAMDGKQFPIRAKKELVNLDSTVIVTTRFKPDYSGFLSYHGSVISDLAEAKLCRKLLEGDPTIGRHLNRMVGAFTSAARIDSDSVLRAFLDAFMTELQSLRFDENTFLKVYREMEGFFYSDVVQTEVFAPLEGFYSDTDVIDLDDGWSIRRVSQARLESLLSDGVLPEESWRAVSHAIVWLVETPKQILEEGQGMRALPEHKRVESSVREVLSGLRLFKNGDVGCRLMDINRISWSTIGASRAQHYVKPHFGRSYELKSGEIDQFREFLRLYRETSGNPALEVAVRRVNYAAERDHQDDHLIDSLVAFESLYLDDTQELGYRLSLRVAAAIREMGPERIMVSEDVKLAYNLRSTIVHGGADDEIHKVLKKKGYSYAELLGRIDCYLRESVRFYMVQMMKGSSRQQLLDELDKSILSGIERKG